MNRIRLFLRAVEALKNGDRYRQIALLVPRNFTPLTAIKPSSNTSGKERLNLSRDCSNQTEPEYVVDSVTYDRVCSETLHALTDYFEELTENATDLAGADVIYGVGGIARCRCSK